MTKLSTLPYFEQKSAVMRILEENDLDLKDFARALADVLLEKQREEYMAHKEEMRKKRFFYLGRCFKETSSSGTTYYMVVFPDGDILDDVRCLYFDEKPELIIGTDFEGNRSLDGDVKIFCEDISIGILANFEEISREEYHLAMLTWAQDLLSLAKKTCEEEFAYDEARREDNED